MSSPADQPINALRSGHDQLVAAIQPLSAAELDGPSGASEWTIADVLSHLGSGAEIGLATLEAALPGGSAPGPDFNQSVWDRWNALNPIEQAEAFVVANDKLVLRYEGLSAQDRNELHIDLGYLPAPADVATVVALRLEEFAFHSWDVRVGLDASATVAQEAVEPILSVIPVLLGWLGKPESVLGGRTEVVNVTITAPDREFALTISDQTRLTDSTAEAGTTLTLPAESWLRLLVGRLSSEQTPAEVTISGPVTLADLRAIFPGL